MTSRTDEIHKLIADIDNLLANGGNRLTKLLSGQGSEERDILQKVRDFLVKLNESETSEEITPDPSEAPLSSLLARYVEQENQQEVYSSYSQQEQSKFIGGQLKDEISVLLKPLQAELTGMLQERATLAQEIRQLEQKRLQNYSLTQQLANQEQIITEFLQVLVSRLVPNLIPYLTRNAPNSPNLTTGEYNQEVTKSAIQPILESADGVERLASLARELDQRLLSLDGTVNIVFQSLERNINTYHQSLSQALAKMHSQGMQGEQMMANFLNNLTEYLQQQSPDTQSFIFGIDTGSIASSPLLEPQAVDDPVEKLTPDIATDSQETPTVEDLDSVLSELTLTDTFSFADESQEQLISDITADSQETPTVEDLDSMLSELTLTDTLTFADESQEELVSDIAADSQETPMVEDLDSVLSELTLNEPTTSATATFTTPDESQEKLVSDIAADSQETPTVEDLDSVLSELTLNKLQSENADEVDQLYASLFGGENAQNTTTDAITLPIVKNEVSTPDQTFELGTQMAESISPSSISSIISAEQQDELLSLNYVESENSTISEERDNSLPEISDTFIEATTQPSELWGESLLAEDSQPQAEFASLPTVSVSLPDSSDTITVLTDLLVDVGDEEEVVEVLSVEDRVETTTNKTAILASPVENQTENSDLLATTYIAASPNENLLSLENSETEGVPEIVLDEAQLQQLDRDLANFDSRLNSETVNTRSLEYIQNSLPDIEDLMDTSFSMAEFPSSESTENIPIMTMLDLDISKSETELDLSLNNVEKQEVTDSKSINSEPKSAVFAGDNSLVNVIDKDSVWYLGIDLGTTGISAALLNYSRLVVYPIYWSAESQVDATSFEQSFRLPAEVYLPTASIPHSEVESATNIEQIAPAVVAKDKTSSTPAPKQNLYSANLKPYLHIAIPYKSTQQKWEPVLQLNDFSAGPLIWVVRSLSKLLLTLKSDQTSTTPALIAHAVGIDKPTFSEIINNIAGVVCTCPSSWSEQYRFNVREAILTSKLVSHPQQIFFVEEAIATLLPELDTVNSTSVQLHENQGLRLLKTSENPLLGNTLTLNIGATSTEMALVDLPSDLSQLTYRDFMLHGFAYAGKAMEQDIICQLLLPPKSHQPRGAAASNSNTSASNPWHWQPSIPGLEKMQWSSLSLDGLELPRVAEPDIPARIRFQQRLESSLLGQALLDAALALKLILQHQESFTLELADQRWVLQRRDLESQVFVPYVRRLNRELNKLLVARGIPTEAINQAILSGGVAAISTVNRWLRQKLPNAKIIQDLYLGENGAPNCSRVAYGLAMLPLHPQVLEIPRQQYTDYFLFTELLKIIPERSLSFGEVLQLFENRGINTRQCQQRLLAFLEGELPAGLIPSVLSETLSDPEDNQTPLNAMWLAKHSQENPDYQAIASAPLFEKQGNLSYRPNSQQLILLRRYLDAVKASSLQSLEEPYVVNFALAINPLH
ncbi:hypothetical protein [Anabaena azotica]|uniref:hypothetical protein n=1 Tax=Anabaena azotica TaxID=197653 RepID=UPI0039A49B4C